MKHLQSVKIILALWVCVLLCLLFSTTTSATRPILRQTLRYQPMHGGPTMNKTITTLFQAGDTLLDINGQPASIKYFDRVSGLVEFEGPQPGSSVIIAGLGARDYDQKTFPYDDTYLVQNSILRSADGGKTWVAITPVGKTDRKVYGLSTNNRGVVVAVTGDRGHPSILSSTDYGLTWVARQATAVVGSTSLYNSYWSESRQLFIVPTGTGTWISSNGVDFTLSKEYVVPLGRNGYSVPEIDQIWVATTSPRLMVLHPGQKQAQLALQEPNGWSFTSFRYLGNNVMLAAASKMTDGQAKIVQATGFGRANNIATITIVNHGLMDGAVIAISFEKTSPFYSVMQNALNVQVIDQNKISVYQTGRDIPWQPINYNVRVATKDGASKLRIYRSTDGGVNWAVKEFPGLLWDYSMVWTRDFLDAGNGVVYFNMPGYENDPECNCAAFFKSTDYGVTWTITDEIIGRDNQKLNAVYRSFPTSRGTFIGAQSDCRLMILA